MIKRIRSRLCPVIEWLRLFPSFYGLSRASHESIFVQEFPGIEAPIREDFLIDACRGKRILHFGFVDSPFSEEATRSGRLLHLQIRKVASFLYGLDIDPTSVALYRELTGDHDNDVLNIEAALPCMKHLAQRFDVILFTEILEHLRNPGLALDNLHQIVLANPRSTLCISVPNAFSMLGLTTATRGIELVHPDHYAYFSPLTLRHHLQSSGFKDIRISLYRRRGSEPGGQSPGLLKDGVLALCGAQAKIE